MEWTKDGFTITCDPKRVNRKVTYDFLASSYWGVGIPRNIFEKSLENSLCFALLADGRQIGFARVISDRATFAYLADVFVLPEHQGKGLGRWLIDCVVGHPELQGFRRWMLATRDAHGLYEKFGFTPLKAPDRFMERHDPDVYKRGAA